MSPEAAADAGPGATGEIGSGDASARRAVVVTVSDGVKAGTREDASGDVVAEQLAARGFLVERHVVADEPDDIARLVAVSADGGARLVVTTGGTGLGPRDRTPDAIEGVVEYVVPGFGEAMRAEGRLHTPLASLSRSLGGVRGRSLVLCLPGSPRGASESLDAVSGILDHALQMLAGRTAHG